MVEPTPRFWLFKSEPEVFSFADLCRSKGRRTCFDGVRNHQARNFLRDVIAVGDGVLFYHSGPKAKVIAGTAKVVRAGTPDPGAFDKTSPYYDPASDPMKPTWYMVDIVADKAFDPPLTRELLSRQQGLKDMVLLQRGSRLSIQPVTSRQWSLILKLAGVPVG